MKRWQYFTLFLLFVATAIIPKDLFVTNVPNTYVPNDLPSRVLNEKVRKIFGSDEIIVVLFTISKEKDFYKKLRDYESTVRSLPNVRKVQSIFSFEYIEEIDDGVAIEKVFSFDNIKKSIARMEKDTNVSSLIYNSNENMTAIIIEPSVIEKSVDRARFFDEIKNLSYESGLGDLWRGAAGEFVVDVAQFNEMISLLKSVIPISMIVGFLTIFLLFRSVKLVGLLFVTNLFVVNICLSIYTLFGVSYNMLSSIIPNILLAINISFFIHLVNSIDFLSCELFDGVVSGLKRVRRPSFISALTTSCGFFALCFSPVPPVRHLGVITGFGILLSYIIIFNIVPKIIVDFSIRVFKKEKDFFSPFVEKTQRFVMLLLPKSGYVIIFFILVFSLLAMGLFSIKTESNLYMFFPDDHEVNQATRLYQSKFSGVTSVDVILSSSNNSLLDVTNIESLQSMKINLNKIKSVSYVYSYSDLLIEFHDKFSGLTRKFLTNEMIEQYLLIYDGTTLYDFLTKDHNVGRVNILLNVQGANEIQEALADVEKVLSKAIGGNLKYEITGQGKVLSDQEDLLLGGFLQGFLLSFLVIAGVMYTYFRSFRATCILMIPNVAPVLATFSMMGLLNIWLDFGTSMIASITLGIAVDDTIHSFCGISRRCQFMSVSDAIEESIAENGKSVIMTTLVLNIQFILLCMSDFMPLQNFGALTVVGLSTALIFDIFFVPCFLYFLDKHKIWSPS